MNCILEGRWEMGDGSDRAIDRSLVGVERGEAIQIGEVVDWRWGPYNQLYVLPCTSPRASPSLRSITTGLVRQQRPRPPPHQPVALPPSLPHPTTASTPSLPPFLLRLDD